MDAGEDSEFAVERNENQMKINHIGYQVKNFEEAKAEFENRRVVFLSNSLIGMIELVEVE